MLKEIKKSPQKVLVIIKILELKNKNKVEKIINQNEITYLSEDLISVTISEELITDLEKFAYVEIQQKYKML